LITRSTLKPQVWFGLKRSVLKGMANSAVQPWSPLSVATSQMPSQSKLRDSWLLAIWPSVRAPTAFVWKKKPLRLSENGSSTIVTWSSTSRSASRASWVATIAFGSRSRQITPTYRASPSKSTRASVSSVGGVPSWGSRCRKGPMGSGLRPG
jgi:hypothetical protein